MRELAVYDYKNYIENGTVGRRPSVRGIIIDKGKIAMVHSLKYDYYNTNPKSKNRQSLFFEPPETGGLPKPKVLAGLVLNDFLGGCAATPYTTYTANQNIDLSMF